jgi:glycosyltransferase involved in cell wall biosynthesis
MRILGVTVANGFASEARVFATLLAHRGQAYDALVLHQARRDEAELAEAACRRFAAASGADVLPADFGWRDSRGVQMSRLQRGLAFARLHAALPLLVPRARAFRPDLVYSSQQRWDCYVATTLARLLGVPQVIHLHYNIGPWLHAQPLRRLRKARAVVCVSEFIRRQAIAHGVAPARAITLYNAISAHPQPATGLDDLRRELGLEPEAEVVLNASRLASGKGHADMLRAFLQATEAHPRAVLLIAGEGELDAPLRALAGELKLGGRVRFLGFRRDVPRLLALSRVFIHPSLQEPCALALLEAAAQGIPTVAYADGGTCELVEDGTTGLLAPTGNVEELGRALRRLLDDPAHAGRLGAAAHERVQSRFDPATQGRAFTDLLAGIVGPPARRM